MSSNSPTWIRAMLSSSAFVPRINSLKLNVLFMHTEGIMVEALVDTGATHNFITPSMTQYLNITPRKVDKPRIIRNVDGTANKGGHITHYVDLEFQQNNEWTSHIQRFYLADLGTDDLILGYPWMAATQPLLNWNSPEQNHTLRAAPEGWMIRNLVLEDGDEVYIGIRKTTHAQQLAEHQQICRGLDRLFSRLIVIVMTLSW